MVKKIEDTFSRLKKLEVDRPEIDANFWKSIDEEVKIPFYLINEEGKFLK